MLAVILYKGLYVTSDIMVTGHSFFKRIKVSLLYKSAHITIYILKTKYLELKERNEGPVYLFCGST